MFNEDRTTYRRIVDAEGERRTRPTTFQLVGELPVDVLVPIGANDHLVLTGHLTGIGESTVTVAMEDGAAALTVATTHRCVLVWGPDGEEQCALVRTGRRTDDVHSPTEIELVLEEVQPLRELIRN